MLEFVTLGERPLEGGGIGAEILIPAEYARTGRFSYERDVKNTGEFILRRVWTKKHFSASSTTTRRHGRPGAFASKHTRADAAAKFDEIEGGLICTRATQLEKEHLLLTISRNPSTISKLGHFGLGRTSREGPIHLGAHDFIWEVAD